MSVTEELEAKRVLLSEEAHALVETQSQLNVLVLSCSPRTCQLV